MNGRFRSHFAVLLVLLLPCIRGVGQGVHTSWGRGGQARFSRAAASTALFVLDGQFRFHPGDDARWAEPGFDDSTWPLLRSDQSWSAQGYRGLSGFAWYRFEVEISPDAGPVALRMPSMRSSYELFADGVRLGVVGKLGPGNGPWKIPEQVFLLPGSREGRHRIVIALRMYHAPIWASYVGGGLHEPPALGTAGLIWTTQAQAVAADAWTNVDSVLSITLRILAAVAALVLFFAASRQREYLWFGLMLLSESLTAGIQMWMSNRATAVHQVDLVQAVLSVVVSLASLMFYRYLLQGRKGPLFWLAVAGSVIRPLLILVGLWNVAAVNALWVLSLLPYYAYTLNLLFRSALRGVPDARLLLLPVALDLTLTLVTGARSVAVAAGWSHAYLFMDPVTRWPFYLYATDLTDFFFLIAVFAVLLLRFVRVQRDKDRVGTELAAARSVQHVLVPEELPATPGLAIQTAYHSAQEVGGDFFQVLSLRTGAVLVVIGDVSGKGMPAALNVALVVGTLSTMVEYTDDPGAILAGLNQRLHARGTGFTTCLALRFSADRRVLTVANAGHLPPYRNGREMVVEPSLPLGLDPDAVFPVTAATLGPGDHLALMTDGVPEAMQGGELFGFAQTEAISGQNAAEIAEAARAFGQSDDITVMTLEVLPLAADTSMALEAWEPA